jgi:hypothetical protein
MHALVAEAMKKAAIIWVAMSADAPAYPLWCMPIDGALYVVAGGDEQPAHGLADATTALVSARGDHGGRIVTWPVHVERLPPGTPDWVAASTPLAGKRLNAPVPTEALVATWAAASSVIRLTPIGDEIAPRSDDTGAAPPRPISARPTAEHSQPSDRA